MKRFFSIAVMTVFFLGCAANHRKPAETSDVGPYPQVNLDKAIEYIKAGSGKKAVTELGKAMESCDKKYPADGKVVYAARGMADTIFYMAVASTKGVDAIAVDSVCSDVLYFRAYVALDLGDINAAESHIKKALVMAPLNSMYLSELGHLYQTRSDWKNALEYFEKAESAANDFSPEPVKPTELARAKRGIGFNLIELGEWDKAAEKFQECLAIDKNDKIALNELEYIKKLKGGH